MHRPSLFLATLAALTLGATLPAGAAAQAAPRDTGLILSTPEAAVARPVTRVADFSLLVDLSDRMLYVKSGAQVIRRFPVSVGQDGYPTPAGVYRIGHLIWNPRWVPPASSWARDRHPEAPGSPGNPMGRVKLFFREPDLYIHGTGLPSSLGRARSHGCIRMRDVDAVELARMVMVHGGAVRSQEWYEATIARADSSREVSMARPVVLRVRA
jgi:lipoprotein-anchoring transpeptidase ErfK/SrfK